MLASTIALNRFGLGARPDDQPPADPKRWLLQQFDRFEPRPQALAQVPARDAGGRAARRLYRRRSRWPAAPSAQMQPASMPTGDDAAAGRSRRPKMPASATCARAIREDYLVMNAARLDSALTTDSPFVERLVHFWANHFAVSVDKLPVIGLAGLLEFEAIRPHVLGRFSDMLLAVEQHPAMLRLSRPGAVDRSQFAGRAVRRDARRQAARPQRESRARDHGAAHARRAHRLQPGRRHRIRPGADRLDGERHRRAARRRG